MTKKEFEDRIGYSIPDNRYSVVERMYLEAGEIIDKDAFCKDYKKHHDSLLLNTFYQQAEQLKDKLDSKREEICKLEAGLLNAATVMLEKAHQHLDDEMYNTAINLIGLEKAIVLKLELNLPLREAERNALIEFMTQK